MGILMALVCVSGPDSLEPNMLTISASWLILGGLGFALIGVLLVLVAITVRENDSAAMGKI